jgi:ubiquinone/menaquinone biosynthesis C-methylase UbiE
MSDELISLTKYPLNDGVYILSAVNDNFENTYLKVREKENRIYSDNELRLLPLASGSNPHKKEWDLRAKSFLRFKEYLKTKKRNLNILDLGCGNGWFCVQLSKSFNYNFYCVDVNLVELKQGRKAFNSEQIKFLYADIFNSEIPQASFDIITVNAAVQYFPNLKKLIERLLALISERGEIHIIDSPFYKPEEVDAAKKRTFEYYASLNFTEMTNNYFHHSREILSAFNYEILYDSNSILNKVKKILMMKDSPFPWIKITR